MIPCPKCHGDSRVIDVRQRKGGGRRRRRECRQCGHRWTITDGSPSRQRGQWLKPHEVERILDTVDRLTVELNCTRAGVVSVLRRADRQATPPKPIISCLECQHWSGACRMGFPDPDEEGPGAAQWCSTVVQHIPAPQWGENHRFYTLGGW